MCTSTTYESGQNNTGSLQPAMNCRKLQNGQKDLSTRCFSRDIWSTPTYLCMYVDAPASFAVRWQRKKYKVYGKNDLRTKLSFSSVLLFMIPIRPHPSPAIDRLRRIFVHTCRTDHHRTGVYDDLNIADYSSSSCYGRGLSTFTQHAQRTSVL